MSLYLSAIGNLLPAFLSLIVLSSTIIPAICSCHRIVKVSAQVVSSSKHQCCEKKSECAVTSAQIATDDCCCKTRTERNAAVSSNSSFNEDSGIHLVPLAIVSTCFDSKAVVDEHKHYIRKITSSFPSTGPPLYILNRALLL